MDFLESTPKIQLVLLAPKGALACDSNRGCGV